jgi:penicillin-binding protein 1A
LLKQKGFSVVRFLLAISGIGIAAGLVMAVSVLLVVSPTLPSIESLKDVRLKVPLRVYSADGSLMAEFGEERRLPVKIEQVPSMLIKAILSAEDDSFYVHKGVDFAGIARAALANLRTGEHGQGASTITMQVARNYFLSPEKTYTRKIKEILLSFKIERELSKDQILELYLNKIFLGHRAYGFASAAQVYYAKPLDELSLPEMAMLAGLPKAPSRNNPLSNPDTARERRNYVLKRMHSLDYISDATYQEATAAPLTASKHIAVLDLEAPYVAEMVRNQMVERYGQAAYTDGYRVHTTIIAKHQQATNKAVRKGLLAYDRRHGYRGAIGRISIHGEMSPDKVARQLEEYREVGELVPAVVLAIKDKAFGAYTRSGQIVTVNWEGMQWARRYIDARHRGPKPKEVGDIVRIGDVVYLRDGGQEGWELSQLPEVSGALVALRPYDGAVVALTGGFNFYHSKFNRAIQAQRQPGSNIKPFIYSAALEKGFTPATRVSGAPIVVEDVSLENVWRPENYSGKFFGPTRLRKALTLSLNLVSIRLLRAISPGFALEHLSRFGFDREKLPKNLSLALGTASLTPLEVVRGYAVFANGGFRVEPYFIDRIENGNGELVFRSEPSIVCATCPVEVDESGPPVVNGELPAEAASAGPRYAPRVISAENAFLMTSIMQDVVRVGTGRRVRELGRSDLAGKTGTTNDYRDAWFSGFNSGLVATVWVGFDQPQPLGRHETGGRAALPIWVDYMRVALEGVPEKPWLPPETITTDFVNTETGQPTTPDDPDGYIEYFVTGSDRAQPVETVEMPAVPVTDPGERKIPEGLF